MRQVESGPSRKIFRGGEYGSKGNVDHSGAGNPQSNRLHALLTRELKYLVDCGSGCGGDDFTPSTHRCWNSHWKANASAPIDESCLDPSSTDIDADGGAGIL
jgi:hypothetical protein